MKKEVTEQEAELIDLIRNYKKAFPNGWYNLEYEARRAFEELMNI